ncbi:MAG: hypothetical protein V4564_20160, partial [Pseudomonadota bacterium]
AGRDAGGNLRVPLVSAGALSIVGSRAFVVKGTVPNTTSSYAGGKTVGGLFTIATGLPAGTIIMAGTLRVKLRIIDLTTAGQTNFTIFDANPTGSTLTDGTDTAVVAADVPKALIATGVNWAGSNGSITSLTVNVPRMAVDASGNIYAVLTAAAPVLFAAANALQFEFDGTY